MSSGVISVPPVMKVFPSPRARRSPDARAAPTLRRDLRHAPLKRPCSRPGSYQRSSGVPVPGDNTPGSSTTGQESHTGTGDPAPTIGAYQTW
ncbi:hypothetical protein DWZ85_03445 [Bifidobacterium longum]|nr:hypothetical protein DWZ85_03445 [Bifidobacterium longum]